MDVEGGEGADMAPEPGLEDEEAVDLAPPIDDAEMGDMAPEEDELALAESYIRNKVRAALKQEAKKEQPQRVSKLDERVTELYNEKMNSLAGKVYAQAKAEVLQETKVNAFSDEIQRRVITKILEKDKK